MGGIPLGQWSGSDSVDRLAKSANRSSNIAIAIAVIALVAATLQAFFAWKASQFKQATYEYKITSVPDLSFDSAINDLGKQGWDLVFARRASNGDPGTRMVMSYEMIFKRQLSPPDDKP